MIQARKLGHIVLKVRDAAKSRDFYTRTLGLKVAHEDLERGAVFLSFGEAHHDLALFQLATGAARQKADARLAVMTSSEMRDHERANILAALEACGGKVFGPAGAAEMLDVKPTTLASRLKALGIAPRARRAVTALCRP